MVQQAQPIAKPIPQQVPSQQNAEIGQRQMMSPGSTSIWKKWWLWLIIAIIVGVGVYYLFF